FFQHGHTYLGHPTACAAALAVQRTVQEEGLVARVRDLGKALGQRLHQRFGDHAAVGDIRGRGLFWGLEFVEDRATKAPFQPEKKLHAKIKQAAMARGLMCYPMGGTLDGRVGDHLLLAPPFIVRETELDVIVDRLGHAIDDVLASL
ncbi:MAG: aminotransferase class III-fold pyridoxal phosphate-dependent enzyme, partial [Pseudomonadota bacterium]